VVTFSTVTSAWRVHGENITHNLKHRTIIVLLGAFPIKTVVMAVVGNSEMVWP